jgi:hypothetical protein
MDMQHRNCKIVSAQNREKKTKKNEIASVNDERVVCRSAAGVDGGGIDANI